MAAAMAEGRGVLNAMLYSLFHRQRHLDRAIAQLTRAAGGAAPDALVLGALSNGHLMRYWRTGSPDDLESAVRWARRAVATGGAERDAILPDLAAALNDRFALHSQVSDVDEAIAACERRLRIGPDAAAQANLALGRFLRHQFTAERADVLAAVTAGREAVRLSGRLNPGHAVRLHVLAQALVARYEYTDHRPDLDEAIAVAGRAVAVRHPLDHRRPLYSSMLATAYQVRFAATGAAADLDAAIEAREYAVREADGPVSRSAFRGDLALTRVIRGALRDDDAELRHAATEAWKAAADIPPGSLAHPMALHNAALIERRVYDRTGDPAALDRAEQAAAEVVDALGAGHPVRGTALTQLARLCLRRADGRAAALSNLREAVRLTGPTLTMRHAVQAAIELGELGAESGDRESALIGFARAAEQLPLAAWPGLPRPVREQRLAEVAEVSGAAALFADPDQAVEILELGRSVMWAQQLDLRTDLAEVAEVAPELAVRLGEISAWFAGTGANGDTSGQEW